MSTEFTKADLARARNRIISIEKHIDYYRFHQKNLDDVARLTICTKNLKLFLDRFPALIETTMVFKELNHGRYGLPYNLPNADHTYYWRVKGLRGPLIATTFPYGKCDVEIQGDMLQFTLERGLVFEVAPDDVPDFYNPGSTTPIVWSRAGQDWRALVKGASK